MGTRYTEISEKNQKFIAEQKIFFVGTAIAEGRVNISPKGMDSLRVITSNRIVWLNVTGSGNETATHVQEDSRMTILFTAFSGKPLILRLYGNAKVIHKNDEDWDELFSLFDPIPGARQIFDMQIDLVQDSCGMAVPYYDYMGDRDLLRDWATKQGDEGLKKYWEKKNQVSIDGVSTFIMENHITRQK